MLRLMSMRVLWLVPLLLLAACGGVNAVDAMDSNTGAPRAPASESPKAVMKTAEPPPPVAATMTVGEERAFPAELVDGRAPVVTVCGTYGLADPNPSAVLVPVEGSPNKDTFRAIAAGKVDLCSLPVQAVEACQKNPCDDHMGDLAYLTTVAVEPRTATS